MSDDFPNTTGILSEDFAHVEKAALEHLNLKVSVRDVLDRIDDRDRKWAEALWRQQVYNVRTTEALVTILGGDSDKSSRAVQKAIDSLRNSLYASATVVSSLILDGVYKMRDEAGEVSGE